MDCCSGITCFIVSIIVLLRVHAFVGVWCCLGCKSKVEVFFVFFFCCIGVGLALLLEQWILGSGF